MEITKTLYHYTRLENLLNIVRIDEETPTLNFWMTHYLQMNDPTEGRLLQKTISEVFPDFNPRNVPDKFILSMSGDAENLPLWREYADNARGIVLALNSEKIVTGKKFNKAVLEKCMYDPQELECLKRHLKNDWIKYDNGEWEKEEGRIANLKKYPNYKERPENKYLMQNMDARHYFNELLAFKDSHYRYEDEYRLIADIHPDKMHFRVRANRLIYCIEYELDIEALEGIYVGPNNPHREEIVFAIKRYIYSSSKINHSIDVKVIDIPYKDI